MTIKQYYANKGCCGLHNAFNDFGLLSKFTDFGRYGKCIHAIFQFSMMLKPCITIKHTNVYNKQLYLKKSIKTRVKFPIFTMQRQMEGGGLSNLSCKDRNS